MTKASFATVEFPWKDMGNDDYKCKVGGYTLRVEKMDEGAWWWDVYSNNEDILPHITQLIPSKERAIGFCEGVYLAHSNATD